VVFTHGKQAFHQICGRGRYGWFGSVGNCWLCSLRGLRECTGRVQLLISGGGRRALFHGWYLDYGQSGMLVIVSGAVGV